MNASLKSPEVIKALHAQGAEPTGGTPTQYRDLIHGEYVRWTKVVKATGATAN
ncbi:tripartite tricarboxylate transporter substrate-binding protein [Cupriavidus consociatus]|uniref:tripartite tricarboxylate transporter substrate-binding protein n=1 Tax=Cupriavidus consociatus TaxID=2821357 RepID=UPI001AE65BEE|nr:MULTISPECIES: tripartite tricarboxylate transporter substrate-binding protein [unclassified Cupriavidus]MBP0620972.1 hypothetical protein [Cupriavidus sp. LEh25]MDK2657642.1 tripartite tricarboxylate transporter substrate-binding protein [Cupriavidus sp. LEh21]